MGDLTWMALLAWLGAGAAGSAALIQLLMPVLRNYALARPNARSSHTVPTPQGGGIAVIVVALAAAVFGGASVPTGFLAAVVGATLGLALIGAADDIRPLAVLPRFLAQIGLVAWVMATMPPDWRILAGMDGGWLILERAVLTVALVYFVNLTNFIDGLDWITAADIVPSMLAVAVFAVLGWVPAFIGFVAVGLAAGMLGFAPFNKPTARVFLGDVGSLPIGLLAGVVLIALAGQGHLAAAVLLAAYPCLDATVTLARRAARGEKVWVAHRSHFYQQATDNGFSALEVSSLVFGLNIALAALAGLTILIGHAWIDGGLALFGLGLAGLLCARFARRR